jgi:hypothetical protein
MVRVVVSYFYVLAIFLVSSGNGNVVPARGKKSTRYSNLDNQL